MKANRILTTLYCILIATAASAQLSSGLVAHWPFNGNAGDSSGNGNHGTSVTVSYGQGMNGGFNTAAIFNGASSYVNVPYKSGMNLSQYSICAIVKPTGYYSGTCQVNAILWRGYQNTSGCYGLSFYDGPCDGDNCSSLDTSAQVFNGYAGTSTGAVSQWCYTPRIVSNTWYTVVLTYRQDTFRCYVNGNLKSTYVATSGTMGSSNEGLYIGASYQGVGGSFPYWFNGFIDDMRLYNRVLSAEEIKHYSNGLYFTPPAIGTICKSVPTSISFSTVNDFLPTNVFNVELSDNTGSFAAATTIGSSTSVTGGNIACTVPGSTGVGGGYRIRIRSTLPAKISDTINVTVGLPGTPPSVYASAAPGTWVTYGTIMFFTSIPTNAGGSPTYQWKKNGVAIPGATSITYGATAGVDFVHNDTITVTVKSSNICAVPDTVTCTPIVFTVIGTDIKQTAQLHNFEVYPNPNKGTFTIKGNNLKPGTMEVRILNAIGQLVYHTSLTINTSVVNQTISLPDDIKGIYFVHLRNNNETATLKMVAE